jgi:hypothetical protein
MLEREGVPVYENDVVRLSTTAARSGLRPRRQIAFSSAAAGVAAQL